jgi:hypothetical protein
LLSSSLIAVPRAAAVRVVALAMALPVIAMAMAPGIAIVIHRSGPQQLAAHYRQVAETVNERWREATGRPLKIAASSLQLIYGLSFYFPDRPSAYVIVDPKQTPWVDDARIAREGMALVCAEGDNPCLAHLAGLSSLAGVRRSEILSVRHHFGIAGRLARFQLLIVPPRR